MAVNEREIVLDSLLEILEKNQYSHIVENAVLEKYDYLDIQSKAFIKRVTEGTVENLITIDGIIDSFSKVRVPKMKPLIRTILRMSVYQIVYMDKVPDSAVCNEAVKLAGKRGFRSLSGFINGVLRNISRNKEKLSDENKNVPEWIYDHLLKSYGQEKTELILKDIDKAHPVTLRSRGEISEKDKEKLIKIDTIPQAFYLKQGYSLKDIEAFDSGKMIVQDVASQLVVLNSEIKDGDIVLDVCSAPGGKAIHAADFGAKVTARDISEKKISIIEDNINRCGVNNVVTQVFDATIYDKSMFERNDVVIADLPCSGLGVMGRKSDIRHKTKKEDLDSLSKIQRQIIDNVWKYVKKGGVLMYSTCTMNPLENEDQVKYIVEHFPFSLEYEKQFLPGLDETDGFYIARLRRNND